MGPTRKKRRGHKRKRYARERLRARYGHAGRTNNEGLTLSEWTNAANLGRNVISGAAAKKGWSQGEDPTEYAALGAKGYVVQLEAGRLVARKV